MSLVYHFFLEHGVYCEAVAYTLKQTSADRFSLPYDFWATLACMMTRVCSPPSRRYWRIASLMHSNSSRYDRTWGLKQCFICIKRSQSRCRRRRQPLRRCPQQPTTKGVWGQRMLPSGVQGEAPGFRNEFWCTSSWRKSNHLRSLSWCEAVCLFLAANANTTDYSNRMHSTAYRHCDNKNCRYGVRDCNGTIKPCF